MKTSLSGMGIAAKEAAQSMSVASTQQKDKALKAIMDSLNDNRQEILQVNREDIDAAKTSGLGESLVDRLSLQDGRLDGIISDINQVIRLPDPVGERFDSQKQGELEIVKCRTPIGVLGVIYEARPNVTIDISALVIKSGNCAILRGGSETLPTNQILIKAVQQALKSAKLPKKAIQLVQNPDRKQVKKLLRMHETIDLIIPRGGAALHQFCRENSTIPVITGGIGICHLFVDESANLGSSVKVVENAKIQRPTVCNALDTLLVHKSVAAKFIPMVVRDLGNKGVQFRVDANVMPFVENKSHCKLADPEDWDTEWLSLILGIRVVDNLQEAIQHITGHSTGHSDGILTADEKNAERFVKEVDSAAVYVNASTRFTDGAQFGLGSEVAISTQKLHARGPMGLKELTTYKWIVRGNYAVRP